MLQLMKRTLFLAKYNRPHMVTGDLANMHLWLQKNGWPSDAFVDLYMRCHLEQDELGKMLSYQMFEPFLFNQYRWVHDGDKKALRSLIDEVWSEKYRTDHIWLILLSRLPMFMR